MKTLKHSRQRDAIMTFLKDRTDHPAADAVYSGIREEFPNISLGTVYRNLNLLVELGEIQKISCGDAKEHFDWNTSPHYHFICRRCGAVSDLMELPLQPMEELQKQAQTTAGVEIDSHSVQFYGTCASCLTKTGA